MTALTSIQRPASGPHAPVDPLFPISLLWKRTQKKRDQKPSKSQTKDVDYASDTESTMSKTETLCAEETVDKKEKEEKNWYMDYHVWSSLIFRMYMGDLSGITWDWLSKWVDWAQLEFLFPFLWYLSLSFWKVTSWLIIMNYMNKELIEAWCIRIYRLRIQLRMRDLRLISSTQSYSLLFCTFDILCFFWPYEIHSYLDIQMGYSLQQSHKK